MKLLGSDERVTSSYDLATWTYPTKWVEMNILGRIPRLQELGRALAAELDSPRYRGRDLTLVGHSQGGLVIQSYLADVLTAGRGKDLRQVRQAIFFATPSEGSTKAFTLRRVLSTLFSNPQDLTLRVLNPDVSDIRSVIRERVVGAVKDSDSTCRIPIHAFCGMEDDVVGEASARGVFDNMRPIPGTHFSILHPENVDDPRYAEFVELLLQPGGHSHRFEVEAYQTLLRVEPKPSLTITTTSDRNRRTVQYDNYATLKRVVRFAPSNRCRHNYAIRYSTRANGYVVGHASHPNLASPADLGLAEDTGTFHRFEFLPEWGQEYCSNLEIYNGYGEGARNVHFHLGDHSYYRRLSYVLDLSSYVGAGWRVNSVPHLYYSPEDVVHTELCAQRASREPVPPRNASDGIYEWDFRNITEGVVDIVWDVVQRG